DPPSTYTPYFFLSCSLYHLVLHSFPTRRSSDLRAPALPGAGTVTHRRTKAGFRPPHCGTGRGTWPASGRVSVSLRTTVPCRCPKDRKSTRLNSSHVSISYAVFCLKKNMMYH